MKKDTFSRKKKEIVKSESETAEIFNFFFKFFSNIVKNLGIPDYDNFDPILENMKEPVILIYKNHPIILAIRYREKKQEKTVSCFKDVIIAEIEKEIKKMRRLS